MEAPDNLKFTDTHEWVRPEADGSVTVGITDHAQQMLGDVVYVNLPEAGRACQQGEECGAIESVKAAADIYAPVAGEILAANAELADSPEKVNQAPYDAWLFRIKPSDPSQVQNLLDAAAYRKVAEADQH